MEILEIHVDGKIGGADTVICLTLVAFKKGTRI